MDGEGLGTQEDKGAQRRRRGSAAAGRPRSEEARGPHGGAQQRRGGGSGAAPALEEAGQREAGTRGAGTGPPAAHWAARLGAGAGGRAGGTGPGRPGQDGGDGDRGGRTLGRAAGALSRSAAHLLAPTPPARGGPRLKYPAKNSLRGRPPIRAARSSNWANGGARDGEARSRQAGPR